MKILVADTVDAVLTEGLRQMGFEVDEDCFSPVGDICQKIQNYEGLIIRSRFPVDATFLAKATQLKFIGRVGAGMENIDVDFAERQKIVLLNAPEGNRNAVGEQAVGMLLMLFNNLKRADTEVRQGIWSREKNRGTEIQGKTIGIIGYGQMGSAFAEKLRGFGTRIIAYDKYKSNFANEYMEEVSLPKLQQEADVVSLHIPQSEETYYMVNEGFIEGFAKPFYLINTARGSAVKTAALVMALKSGKVIGACLDVLEYEKASFENMFSGDLPADFQYLVKAENVILSPHIAGWTFESNEKMAQVILEKLKALKFINGNRN